MGELVGMFAVSIVFIGSLVWCYLIGYWLARHNLISYCEFSEEGVRHFKYKIDNYVRNKKKYLKFRGVQILLLMIFGIAVGIFIGTQIKYFDYSWLATISGAAAIGYGLWTVWGKADNVPPDQAEGEFLKEIMKDEDNRYE
jgi:hypothetical protein